jgi:hypothetical protein
MSPKSKAKVERKAISVTPVCDSRCSRGRSKLTERDVREIRRRYGKGRETFAALATAFNVSPQTIGGIVHRRSWQHVA